MIKPSWPNLSALSLTLLLATACELATSAPVADPRATAPAPPAGVSTSLPAPTETSTRAPPPGTVTPVTPSPAHAMQETARQATIVARATTSPFPTAGPATVQMGRPASATTRRDGLSFQIRLPKDTYLAGEGGQVGTILRNEGPEMVFVTGSGPHLFRPTLLDERGHEPAPWPWPPMILPGPPYLRELAPGQAVSETLPFQVLPVEQLAGHTYVLWVETRFSRPQPDRPEGPDNLWLHLETGPIPLQVTVPDPAQRLVAQVETDRDGWHLRVIDATGQSPPGPLWGFREVASPNAASAGPLRDSADGTWSGAWDGHMRQDGGQICLRVWVATPGYVTAAVTRTVPGEGNGCRLFGAWEPSTRQTFASLEAAQAALNLPLFCPRQLPASAILDSIQAETRADQDQRWTDVHQSYRLPDDVWLELTQMVTAVQYASAGWGQARYAPEARPVTVGQATGYLVRQFGWWVLDWKEGDVGFELRAPVQAFSLEELLNVATGMRPPG